MEFEVSQYPLPSDGPQKRTWAPAIPACVGRGTPDSEFRAFRLSVQTQDGVTHRFLMSRAGMAWIVFAAVCEMSPWIARPAYWWFRRQVRNCFQSDKSSGTPSAEGSPQEGQAV